MSPREPSDGGSASAVGSAELALIDALLHVTAPDRAGDTVAHFAGRLLDVLVAEPAVRGCRVELDREDGRGAVTLAVTGHPPDDAASRLSVDLALSPPWHGHLAIDQDELDRFAPDQNPAHRLVALRIATALETERLRSAAGRQQEWLTYLIEVGNLLAESRDAALTTALIPHLLVPRLSEWCALYLLDRDGQAQLTAAVHAHESVTAQMLSDQHPLGVHLRSPVLIDAVTSATITSLPPPLEGFAVALEARGALLGALAVGGEAVTDLDGLVVVEEVARRSAAALDNARVHDERQRVAHTLQQALLPPALPSVAGVEIATQYIPAGQDTEVGGDLYDVISLRDGRLVVLIGDVAGKGIRAATVTSLVREVLRILLNDGKSIDEALTVLNATLRERSERYCTLALCDLAAADRAADDFDATIYLAGHDRPALVRADGTVTPVGSWGTALGVLDRVLCPPEQVRLSPGDSLVLYTDGATERRTADSLFGHARLYTAAGQLAGHSAEVMAASLVKLVLDADTDPPRDDIAIVAVRNARIAG